MEEKLTFSLTGSFQYDVAILGLRRVLDFFCIESEPDDYNVKINLRDWQKIGQCAYLYGYLYRGVESVARKIGVPKARLPAYSQKEKITEFSDIIRNGSKERFEDFLNRINEFFKKESKETRENIFRLGKRGAASYPALTVVNLTHQNSFNPQHSGGNLSHYYSRFCDRFSRHPKKQMELADETCDFCGGYRGKELNRQNFLFAPAALNYSWFEKTNLRICYYCSALNMLAMYGTTPFAARHYLIYSSNLSTMVGDNDVLAIQAVTGRQDAGLLRNYALGLLDVQTEVEHQNKLFVEFIFSGQNPDVRILPLTTPFLEFLRAHDSEIRLFAEKHDFTAYAGGARFDALNVTLKSILAGETILPVASDFMDYLIKQLSGNKNMKGFHAPGVAAMLELGEKWKEFANKSSY